MGVMDNLLHKEFARVASLSNGGAFEGRSGKLSSPGGPPKYKQRRVSAIRDFPPGCGWFTFQINGTPNEGIIVDTIFHEANNLLHSSNHVNRPELVSTDAKGTLFPESGNLKPLECEIANVSKNLNAVDIGVAKEDMFTQNGVAALSPHDQPIAAPGNSQEKIVTRNYPPRRRISAIRDFPPFCGQNASCLGKEECINVIASLKSLDEEKPVTEDRSLRGTLGTDTKLMEEDNNHGDAYKSKLNGDVSRITCDKDQADLEGHAAMGTKKHDEFETSSKNDMNVAEEDTGENSIESPQEAEQYRFDCKTCVKSSSKDVAVLEENPVRDIVVYAEEGQLDRNYPDLSESNNQFPEEDSEKIELKSNLVIVHGLMASSNCPWRQGKRFYKPNPAGITDESKRKKHDLPQLYKYAFNTKNESKSSEGSLTKKNTSPDGEADHGMGALVIWNGDDSHGHDEAHKNFHSGERKRKKHDLLQLRKAAFKTKNEAESSEVPTIKRNTSPAREADHVVCPLAIWNGEDSLGHDGPCKNSHVDQRSLTFDVNLLPSRPSSSMGKGPDNDVTGTRNKVRETLRLFQAVCRKLLQEEEAKANGQHTHKRIDYLAARILKDKGKYVNVGKQIIGSVPGVEVGDEFHYRVELNIIGLHRQIQGGIDYVKHKGKVLATSIVASGGYDDDLDNSDVLTYTGQGGNVMNGGKEPEDQKLERGNLALVNSTHEKNPVRVIRGETKASDSARTYIYDGLYLVERYWQDLGPHGKLVFKFRLTRIQGQPELAWKVVKKCKKFKVREGVCVTDISQGKELIPICAVNTIDDEKPPPFTYTTSIIYPDWCHPIPSEGCDCTNRCSDSGQCSCATKNGGEIPYNHNGAIVEVKPLVYECGPACKCPPSCYNRVSQHGIKLQLEIFKTESRGWGVRSLNSIASGSFICEYVGELLEEKEAEKRTGNDEYLFDIGHNDSSLWDGLSTLMPDTQSSSCGDVEDGGFTIDAAQYGNVGRFINHSCSPNLYAQNVLYDHGDKRIPHIMLFAAENIPPLQELTYHYNYVIDQVHDSEGNIKKKSCYCGSSECTGRLY